MIYLWMIYPMCKLFATHTSDGLEGLIPPSATRGASTMGRCVPANHGGSCCLSSCELRNFQVFLCFPPV